MPSLAQTVLRELTSPDKLVAEPWSFDSSHVAATAAMTLATLRRACELNGVALRDQRVVVRGAGARGLAFARAVKRALQETGMTWRETSSRVFVVDSSGLVLESGDTPSHLRRYAARADDVMGWSFKGRRPSLLETIANSGATVLVGLSGQKDAFGEEVVRAMCANDARPIILPFSWPEGRREASMADIATWSDGAAIALGPEQGPADAGCIEGWTLPGVALGRLIAGADIVDEDMVVAAARAMHDQVAEKADRLVPTDDELADTTLRIATEVVRAALRSGAADNPDLSFSGLEDYVEERLEGEQPLPDVRDDDGWEGSGRE